MHEAARVPLLPKDRLIRRLVTLVTKLDLDRRDFVIFGSGPLLAHGLRRCIRDLDVVARGAVWRRVSQHGCPGVGTINGAPMALFWDGLIQFSPGWISDDWDTDDLIDRAEIIHGLPFAQLTDVFAYKQMLNRPKDRLDIEVLHDLLLSQAELGNSSNPHHLATHGFREVPKGFPKALKGDRSDLDLFEFS